MRKYYLSSALMLSFLASTVTFAQSKEDLLQIKGATRVKVLNALQENLLKSNKEAKLKALKVAKQKGWKVKGFDKDGSQFELVRLADDGSPIYYTTYNVNAANSTRANTLNKGGLLSLNLNGENMKAYVWDGGHSLVQHTEFSSGNGSKVVKGEQFSALQPGNHATHVMGTILAAGKDPKAKGMANKASGVCYEWTNDDAEVAQAAAKDMILSNHSYGFKAGKIPDSWFGAYGEDARDFDQIMYNAPYYLMCVAAGNDGRDDFSNAKPLDGQSKYDKLSGTSTSKNNLVVANFRDANIDGQGNLVSVERTQSSSEGPTDDYRIKPDICGNGYKVWSSNAKGRNSYQFMTGTSMASPNVCGTLLLLQQHHKNVKGELMKAATLKGLALHTADDVATKGPDATSGWGLLNAKLAAQTITGNGKNASIKELKLTDGSVYTANVKAIPGQTLKVSISWTDLPSKAEESILNNNKKKLINDLDLEVSKGSKKYLPWLLTGVTTNGKGDNDADPFERVDIADADGTYKIKVSHEGKLTSGSQNYSIIVTGGIITSAGGGVNPDPTPVDPINPPSSCDKNEASIDLNTGNYGYEIGWAILDSKNKVVAKGEKYKSKQVVNLKECLADGCYKLRLTDQYGDGFSGAGSIKVTVKGNVKVEAKGNFGKTKDYDFCIEDKGGVTPPSDCKGVKAGISLNSGTYGFEISWSILDGSGKKVLEGANYQSNKSINLTKCLPKGCYTFKINDRHGDGFAGNGFIKIKANGKNKVDVSGNFGRSKSVEFCLGSNGGGVNPTPPVSGCDGQMAVVNLNTGKFGDEIDWLIQNTSGDMVLKGGNYPSEKIVESKECLPAGCYKFTINDKYGDGFGSSGMIKLSIAGNPKFTIKGNFGKSKSTYFCIDKNGGYSDGAEDNDATIEMLIYPNPAKTEYVKLKSNDIQSGVYEIFSFDGTLVSQGKFENGDTQVNIKGLASGTYLVKVSSKNGLSVTKQLIIRK